MKNVIVTGANGFVGYWLIKELAKHNCNITAVIKDENENISMLSEFDNVNIVYCDLSALETLKEKLAGKTYDTFYHIAWIAAGGIGRADYNLQLLNVKYACDALKVASELGCKKILFAGTITEKLTESIDRLSSAVNNIYGVVKNTTHSLVKILSQKYNIDYVWMRFANLYGPHSVNGNIVGYTIKELLSGNDATFGPAQQPYDFVYIEDLAYAAYLLGEKETKKDCYYLGCGDIRKLSDYLLEIGSICGKSDKIKIGARPDDGTRYNAEWFEIKDLKEDTGYEPKVSLQEGVTTTMEWMKTNND